MKILVPKLPGPIFRRVWPACADERNIPVGVFLAGSAKIKSSVGKSSRVFFSGSPAYEKYLAQLKKRRPDKYVRQYASWTEEQRLISFLGLQRRQAEEEKERRSELKSAAAVSHPGRGRGHGRAGAA